MTAFPRTFIPTHATLPLFPTGLGSWGPSGKGQFRTNLQVGRTWEERWGAQFDIDPGMLGFIALINKYWRDRTILTVAHLSLGGLLGAAPGTPADFKVDGANQTGSTLSTKGWTATQNGVLKAGDVITLAGLNPVYDVTEDANSDGAGKAPVKISPPIFTGKSPADNALITTNKTPNSVLFRVILEQVTMPSGGGAHLYEDLAVRFRETI